MKKILLALLCLLFLVCSCKNGKSETNISEQDTVYNEKVQDTFYGCKFGEQRDSVVARFLKEGFEIDSKESSKLNGVYLDKGDQGFKFGGLPFDQLALFFTATDEFSEIMFCKESNNKSVATHVFDGINNLLSRKYTFKDCLEDKGIVKDVQADGANGVDCAVYIFRSDSTSFITILDYSSEKIWDKVPEEL